MLFQTKGRYGFISGKALKFFIVFLPVLFFLFLLANKPASAASLLFDSFDKPTIDTDKWTKIDTENRLLDLPPLTTPFRV
jgi:hypothetical protein